MENNKRNRDRLIEQHTHIVKYTAAVEFKKHSNHLGILELSDFEGAGFMGLVEAVDSYDKKKGCLLRTHIINKVKIAIKEHIRNNSWLSRSALNKGSLIEKARFELLQETMSEPTNESLSEKTGLSVSQIEKVRRYYASNDCRPAMSSFSENNLIYESEGGKHSVSVEEKLSYKTYLRNEQDTPETLTITKIYNQTVHEGVSELNDRQFDLIVRLYFNGETLSAIGKDFGVSESRAYQIRRQAFKKLSRFLV